MSIKTVDHLHLKCNDLENTRAFYKQFLDVNELHYHDEEQLSVLSIDRNQFVIQFQQADQTVENTGNHLGFIGLELESFHEVDQMIKTAEEQYPELLGKDMRDQFRNEKGPYGFFIEDPTGYTLKIFKYNYGKDSPDT